MQDRYRKRTDRKKRMNDTKKTHKGPEAANLSVPLHLKHRPILALEEYEHADGNKAGNSEAKGLSIGLAQWNSEDSSEVSAKIWRHTGDKWSRQSEEMPLHRILDLTILVARARLLFRRYRPTDLGEKPGYPLIDNIHIQGTDLPVSACTESETFDTDVGKFESALNREEVFLKQRFDILTGILSETETVQGGSPVPPVSFHAAPPHSQETQGRVASGPVPWYRRIELKDIILTLIAFVSIMFALAFASQVRSFTDLSLSANDIIIQEGEEDTIDLWIRQKNGIESVLITRQIVDYGTGTGHYACIDPRSLLASEGELRIADGVFLSGDEKGYPLVDSTTEYHPELGDAYHLMLPREILYQSGDGVYHAVTLYNGAPLTITSFRKDFADYRDEYRINPFTLQLPWWPSDELYHGTFSLDALAKRTAREAYTLEQRLRSEFNDYRISEIGRYDTLRNEGLQALAALEMMIDQLRDEGITVSQTLGEDLDALRSEGSTAASAINDRLSALSEEGIRITVELREKIALLERSGTERDAALDQEIADLLAAGTAAAASLESGIEALGNEQAALVNGLRQEGLVVATALENDLVQIQQAMQEIAAEEPTAESDPAYTLPNVTFEPYTEPAAVEEPLMEEEPDLSDPEALLSTSPQWRIEQLFSADMFMKEEAVKLVNKIHSSFKINLEGLLDVVPEGAEANSLAGESLIEDLDSLVENVSGYSKENRENIRSSLISLQSIAGQLSDHVRNLQQTYLASLAGHREGKEADGVSQDGPSTIQYYTLLLSDLDELRNTVRMFNNMDIFSSIEGISKDGIDVTIRMKYEEVSLTQTEALSRVSQSGYEISSYEMFLIFSVFFDQYYQ